MTQNRNNNMEKNKKGGNKVGTNKFEMRAPKYPIFPLFSDQPPTPLSLISLSPSLTLSLSISRSILTTYTYRYTHRFNY